ncbi:MAG: MFS transporter, partial [Propionibacteriales bacterium]|nr:MFS transporter [Propionibacteriales bacterium]
LVLVGTVLEATCFLGEIPTGIVADLRSRKVSVIIGLTLIGVGIMVLGLFPSFWPILLAQVIWGLGFTFVSGADEAWVTDEVGQGNVQPIFTRAHQWSLTLNIVGILLAGGAATLFGSLQAPIIAGGVGFLALAGVMIFAMKERKFAPTPARDRNSWGHMTEIARTGLRAARRPGVVRSFLIIGLLVGLSSEVFDRLWVDRITNDFPLPAWFGEQSLAVWFTLFALIASLIGLVASVTANRLAPAALHAEHPIRSMALLAGLQVLGVVLFALAGNVGLALAGSWLRAAATSVAGPIRRAWLNRNVASSARATTVSMMGQADALGQVTGGPALGALANAVGIPIALLVAGAVQLPTVVVYLRLRPNRGESIRGKGDEHPVS